MPLPIICGGISFLGLLILYIALRDRKIDRRLCPTVHRIGPARCTHSAAIECDLARLAASWAIEPWELLREEFPAETEEEFPLELKLDPAELKGRVWFSEGIAYAVVNLWGIDFASPHPIYLEEIHPLGETDRGPRGTIAEELHHLVWFRKYGHFDYVYTYDPESRDRERETILYYALNEHETEALRFAVRATGERRELLEKVEAYLAGR